MERFPTPQTLRTLLVASAAFALSACAAGSQQHFTPAGGAGLSPAAVQHTTSESSRGGDNDRGGEGEGAGDGGGTVVYSSIPKPVKSVASLGFEAYQGLEFGDGVNLTRTGTLLRVRYVLSSWGCQSGRWYSAPANPCMTSGHPTFPVPFTVNVYAVDNAAPKKVGSLLTTQTKTFNIPYRPSSDPVKCPQSTDAHPAERFYSPVDAACVHGLANVISFTFGAPRVTLPAQTIVTLVYNTTHYGPHPIGESAPCYTSSGGCGYDSLNVSADGLGGPVGSPYDPNGIFDSFVVNDPAVNACTPGPSGLRLDTAPGCWTKNHPQLEVTVSGGKGGHDDD